jgi:broad specificity phosphatase PhoE
METHPSPYSAGPAFFSCLERETSFFILRHGQSEGNAKRVFQGLLDMPLNDEGRAQAGAAGRWLASRGVSAVLSSPLARASETAGIVARSCGVEPVLDGRLAEIDTGIFTGLGFEESRALHPSVFAAFEGSSWEAVPGAEKAEALYARAMEAWSLMRERALAGAGALVCVSHGGFIQWLLRVTFGARAWMPLFSTANCGIFELLAEPRGEGAYLQWRHFNYQADQSGSA